MQNSLLTLILLLSAFAGSGIAQPQGPGGRIPSALEEALKNTGSRRNAEAQIDRRWKALGGTAAPMVPGIDGIVPTGNGYYREYVGGGRMYYRPSDQRPFLVYGHIHVKYRQLGGTASGLGWPTSDEQEFTEGGRVTTFERGAIYWWADTGAIELNNIVVRYMGLYCFGETDNDQSVTSSADEPYVIFGVIPPSPAVPSAPRTRIYEGVDARESREDNIELYRGPPYGLGLTTTLMEHDLGDPDKKRDLVKKGIEAAHNKGVEASASIPYVGPAVAIALKVLWELVGDDAVKVVNDTFNFEDDQIDVKSVYISGKQMVTLARAGRQNLKGIEWQMDSPLLSGHGASYKAYFVIEAVEPAVAAVAESTGPYNTLGRVKPSTGVPSRSICESARAARARNSPAAPGLEAQCLAAGAAGETIPKALGRVKLPPTGAPPATPISICDSARGARARNSPAAPGLEAQCRTSLAAIGAAIAEADPTVAAARDAEADALYRQGFDIATAIFGDPALGARGNTATGPGSLGIRDALSAAGQRGFKASVALHLSRNYKP